MIFTKKIVYYTLAALLPAFLPMHLAAQKLPDFHFPISEEPVAHSCVDIPRSIDFCGQTIDLSRFDRRERMDKELLTFMYMHSTSLQTIKRANRYFPVVAPILKANGVPEDLLYLMVIESNLNPTARSRAGAVGLWQLMPATAKELGLEVNDEIDERMNVEKATEAACKYLLRAYKRFGNWESVAASYNAGQRRISDLMDEQDVDNALDLYMVEETSRYVYRILAAKLMFQEPQAFGFHLKQSDLYPPLVYTTVDVSGPVESWSDFAQRQGITYATLRRINPWITAKQLRNKTGRTYSVAIPTAEWMNYNPLVTPVHDWKWIDR